jgi:hypothetical protein
MKTRFPAIQNPLFAVMLGLVSVAAYAQTPGMSAGTDEKAPEWSDSDTDRDGFLSKNELIPFPGVLKKFDHIDTDADGKISEAEYRDWRDSKKR